MSLYWKMFIFMFGVSICLSIPMRREGEQQEAAQGAIPQGSGGMPTQPGEGFEATTEEYNQTDLPKDRIEEALNVDEGKYVTQLFDYQNTQKTEVKGDYNDTCINSYIDCVLNQVMPAEVCAYNQPFNNYYHGHLIAASYCEVHFDNCRRGYRVWRTLSKGICNKNKEGWHRQRDPHRLTDLWGPRITFKNNF